MENPVNQNGRFQPTGLATPGRTCGVTGMSPILSYQEAEGWLFG